MQHASLAKLLDAIEAELRRLAYLIGDPDRLTRRSPAFGYDLIPFEQWLGHVFLPSARAALVAKKFPQSSQVATAAIRNLDGVHEDDNLLDLLSSFDSEIDRLGNASGIPRDA